MTMAIKQIHNDKSVLCGIPVHIVTLIFGLLCLFVDLSKLFQIVWMIVNEERFSWPTIMFANFVVASIVVTIVLIYANRSAKPQLYWPFVFFQGFYVVFLVTCSIFSFAFLTAGAIRGDDYLQKLGATKSMVFVYWLVVTIFAAVHFYFGIVVVDRSRRMHKTDLASSQPPSTKLSGTPDVKIQK
ncbi:hypothetical protein M3Y94_00724600 [Aphelenchoides besseyi]|nr:hypothetical protein M3Y94_00724600 [Aphelenchoides besseyi]KAI6231829.1 hypothetical protein M3Y95_00422500 [Aphelenchoides besseyi]